MVFVSQMLLIGFPAALAGILVLHLLQGRISLAGLTAGHAGGAGQFSRVQLLLATIFGAAWYFTLILDQVPAANGEIAMPPVPDALLLLMGLSNGGYLAAKMLAGNAGKPDNS